MRASRARPKYDAREYFTCGDVEKMIDVSARTVAKWCDAKILPSFRLPLSKDRRIARKDLIAFLRGEGIPMPTYLQRSRAVLCVGCEPSLPGMGAMCVRTPFEAGMFVARSVPQVCVVSFLMGRIEAQELGESLKREGVSGLIGLIPDDWPLYLSDVYDVILKESGCPIGLLESVHEQMDKE